MTALTDLYLSKAREITSVTLLSQYLKGNKKPCLYFFFFFFDDLVQGR